MKNIALVKTTHESNLTTKSNLDDKLPFDEEIEKKLRIFANYLIDRFLDEKHKTVKKDVEIIS